MDTRQIKLVDVNPYVMCTLCSGYIVDATTIIECLHSFCKTCIYRYLEANKLCPICDVLVHKTRPLLNVRPDKTFQALIYKIVPGLYKDEMERCRNFYAKNPQPGVDSISLSIPEQQTTEYPSISILSPSETLPDWVSLCLELSDRLPPFAKVAPYGQKCVQASGEPVRDQRHLLCPAGLTVGHLKKFLRGKFGLFANLHIDIFHSDEILKDVYSLSEIANIYTWRRVEPLKLYYVVYSLLSSQAVDFSVALKVDNNRVVRDCETALSTKADNDSRQTTSAATLTSSNPKTTSVKRRKVLHKMPPASAKTGTLEIPKEEDSGDVSSSDLTSGSDSFKVAEATGTDTTMTLVPAETINLADQNSELSGNVSAVSDHVTLKENEVLETCNPNLPDSSSISDLIEPCTVNTSTEIKTNSDTLVDSTIATNILSTTTPKDNKQHGNDECVPSSIVIEEKCGFESQLASSDVENHDQTKKENRPTKKRTSEVEQLFLDQSSTREVRNLYREFAISANKRGRSSQLRLRLRTGSVVRRRSVGLSANRSGKTRASTSANRSKSYSGRAKAYVVRRRLVENNKKK